MTKAIVHGTFDPAFIDARDMFAANFAERGEVGDRYPTLIEAMHQ